MQAEKSPRMILRSIFLVLFRKKALILTVFVCTLSLMIFLTFLITPEWKATTKILVLRNPKQQMILFKDLSAPAPMDTGPLARDLVELLNSKAFAVEIVKKYKLDEMRRRKVQCPENARDKIKLFLVEILRSPLTLASKIGLLGKKPPNFFAKALEDFMEDMEDIELQEGTSTINLSIWAETPILATSIANTLASMLIDKTKQFERSEAAEVYDFARVHLQSVKGSLEKAEDELGAFKERERVVDLDMEKSLTLQRLDRLVAEYDTTQRNLAAVEVKLEELQHQLSSQPESIITSEVTGNNVTYERLKNTLNEAEIKLVDLQKTLRDKHPDFLGLKAQIELNRQKLQEEEQRVLLNETTALNLIHRDLQQQIIDAQTSIFELRSKRDSLQKALDDLKKAVDSLPREEIALERLTRSVSGLKKRYLDLRDRLLELEIQKFTEISQFDVKISDPAFIPEGAKYDQPRWVLNVIVGMIIGLLLGVTLAFFQEYWSDTLKIPEEVSDGTGLKVLGTVPPISPRKVLGQVKG